MRSFSISKRASTLGAAALAALTLAVAHAPGAANAYGTAPGGMIGVVDSYEIATSTNTTTPVGVGATLTFTIPANSMARCVRVGSSLRLATNVSGTTGNAYIFRNGDTVFGETAYIVGTGAAGSESLAPGGVDALFPGTYTYSLWIKKAAGAGDVTSGFTAGSDHGQQLWVEDVGVATEVGNGCNV